MEVIEEKYPTKILTKMLTDNEIEYFISLYKNYGVSYLNVDEEGVGFDEEELQMFLSKENNPEINLEKMLLLNKITKTIFERIKFNYNIITTENKEVQVKLEFFE